MKQVSLQKQLLGRLGEALAAKYLENKGFRIIDRNFKKLYGELDLIALDHQTLVIVEVKTRINREFGLPEEAVTPRKLREIIQTALFYKSLHGELPDSMRIDVIAIEMNIDGTVRHIRHIPNVTQ